MEPARALSMVRITALVKLKQLFRLTLITRSHCSSVMRMSRVSSVMPALLMTMSTVPKASTTSFTKRSASVMLAASDWKPCTVPPPALSSSSRALAASAELR